MHRERVDEVVRVGLNVIGLVILGAAVLYIALQLWVWFIQGAAHA